MSVAEAAASLVEALDARRTDIVKTLLDHLGKDAGPGVEEVCCIIKCVIIFITHPNNTIPGAGRARHEARHAVAPRRHAAAQRRHQSSAARR